MSHAFRHRLLAAGLDYDAVNVIVNAGQRPDIPPSLAGWWDAYWHGPPLAALVALSPADRQHALAREVDKFMQSPAHLRQRVAHAVAHPYDADLRTVGVVAGDLIDILVAFGQVVAVPAVSSFTGKLKYHPVTDIDTATAGAIVEVTTRPDAAGKVAQLAELLGPIANPRGVPVYHYTPAVPPTSRAARALRAAGSAGVYNDRAALVAAVRALP